MCLVSIIIMLVSPKDLTIKKSKYGQGCPRKNQGGKYYDNQPQYDGNEC
jgi:hypothetical protein